MVNGTLNAAGSGQRSSLPDVPMRQLSGINIRLSPPEPKVERDHTTDMQLIEDQLLEVRSDYVRAVGQSAIDYELKDAALAARLGMEFFPLS